MNRRWQPETRAQAYIQLQPRGPDQHVTGQSVQPRAHPKQAPHFGQLSRCDLSTKLPCRRRTGLGGAPGAPAPLSCSLKLDLGFGRRHVHDSSSSSSIWWKQGRAQQCVREGFTSRLAGRSSAHWSENHHISQRQAGRASTASCLGLFCPADSSWLVQAPVLVLQVLRQPGAVGELLAAGHAAQRPCNAGRG